MRHERYVRRVAEGVLPTRYGDFRMIVYASDVDREQHIALVRGESRTAPPPLVRVHSHCLTGDVFGSTTCDCHEMVARIARQRLRARIAACWSTCTTPAAASASNKAHRDRASCRACVYHTRGRIRSATWPASGMLQHESGIGAQILIDLGLTRCAC